MALPLFHRRPAAPTAASSGVRPRERADLRGPALRVLFQEAIEGIASPHVASDVLAAAAILWRRPFPDDAESARAFVDGPLARALHHAHLDDDAIHSIRARIDGVLAPAKAASVAENDDEPTRPNRLVPARVPTEERVRVLVFESGAGLADALRSAPHGEGLVILSIESESALAGALHATGASVLVVDAVSCRVHGDRLAELLRDRELCVVVAGADQPAGRLVLERLGQSSTAAIGLGRGQEATLARLLRSVRK
jgi:hypothetical protein